jgi:hypothetical protein
MGLMRTEFLAGSYDCSLFIMSLIAISEFSYIYVNSDKRNKRQINLKFLRIRK